MAIAPLIYETHPAAYPSHRAPDIGDLLVSYLGRLGVEFVFGVPGGAIEPLYNALARGLRYGGPQPVVARHETGAAFMAQGYASETGRLGVCCATTGPGATNALTGVASAYQDEVPMLVITGQTALRNAGRAALQDSSCNGVDTLGMYSHCTRYNTLVSDGSQFEHKLVAALAAAFGDTPGPVHIAIPVDLLRSPSPAPQPSFDLRAPLANRCVADEAAQQGLWQELTAARRFAIVMGSGCAESAEYIVRFAEYLNIPLVTTPGGKGLLSPYHPLYRGVFGFAGHASARELLADPLLDVVLAVGTGLTEWDTAGWDEAALLNERLIHIDPSGEHLGRSPMARLHVQGRILTIFQRLIERIEIDNAAHHAPHLEAASASNRDPSELEWPPFMPSPIQRKGGAVTGVKPQDLMAELSCRFPPGTRFFADAGNSTAWAVHYLHVTSEPVDHRGSGGWFRISTQFAPMGWAIGGAVGSALGRRTGPVVCITGDGSVLMNGQELTVAVAEGLTVIFVVLNDGALGMVKHGQRLAKAEPIAFELPPVDFCAMGKAMGANAYRIRTLDELRAVDMEALCGRGGPTLLEVLVDPEEVPPIGTRVKVLGGEL